MNFDELPEFQKECKRLGKKYKSLPEDLQEFKKVILVDPLGNSKHFKVLTENEFYCIVKARLFCKYLKGSSLRVIYAYLKEKEKFDFIEVYFKGDKETEDSERVTKYCKKL